MYVPKRQPNHEYEGNWSGPLWVPVDQIRRSHGTSRQPKVAAGYEDKPIRIQRWPTSSYAYRIVDGNKRLAAAKRNEQELIEAYIYEPEKNDA